VTGSDEPIIFNGTVGGDVESHVFDLQPDGLSYVFPCLARDLTIISIGSMHNVHVNEELNYGIAMGNWFREDACRGGLIFFNLTDPSSPNLLGCAGEDGYVHDVSRRNET